MKSNKNIYAEWLNALCAAPNCCTTTKIGSSPIHEKFSCRGTGIPQRRWSVLKTIMLLCPSTLSHHQSPGGEGGHVLARLIRQGHLILDLPAGRWLPGVVQMLNQKQAERFGVNVRWLIRSPSQSRARSRLSVGWTRSRMLSHLQRNWNRSTTGKKASSPPLLS